MPDPGDDMQQKSARLSLSPFARFASHKEGVLGAEWAGLPSEALRGLFSMTLLLSVPQPCRAAQSRYTQIGSHDYIYIPEALKCRALYLNIVDEPDFLVVQAKAGVWKTALKGLLNVWVTAVRPERHLPQPEWSDV